MRYRNISGHAEDLEDGRVVGYLGDESYVELSEEDLKSEFNQAKIEQGNFIEAPEPDEDHQEPTVPELKDRAKELGVTGFSSMNKEELIQAIAEAETTKIQEDDG